MNHALSPAPHPAYRLIASRFPPVGLFDTVATAADLAAVMDLAGWTNDRLAADRIARLPQAEWVYGRPNASIVMAAFLHVAPGGMRFNGSALGAWYASADIATAAAEVGHHLRREAVATGLPDMTRIYQAYSAGLNGIYLDIRDRAPALPQIHTTDSYADSQPFGEAVRASADAGFLSDSIRRRGGVNSVAYRPTNIRDIAQADHWEIHVAAAARRIEMRRLATPA